MKYLRAMPVVFATAVLFLGLLVFTASWLLLNRATKPTDANEPTIEIVRSGSCVVDICSSVDMGDYTFRYYAEHPTVRTLQYIRKGQCQCKAIKLTRIKRDYATFDAIGKNGQKLTHISVVSTGREHYQPPTIQDFERKRGSLEEITDFRPGEDSLKSFRIYRSREPHGAQVYDYYLIPRVQQFSFQDKTQPIAFSIPNGLRQGPPLPTQLGDRTPSFSSAVRLYGSICIFQFFDPRRQSSDYWINLLEQSAEVADTRLFPKNETLQR
ncbi:MAG: hypothetical protein ACTHM2_20060 [Afipia sp.]|jgi:hypothetical protein